MHLLDLQLDEDCRTPKGADILLYDNGSDESRVIILATSDNLTITVESTSWYLDDTFQSAYHILYQLLVLHSELIDSPSLFRSRVHLMGVSRSSVRCPSVLYPAGKLA